MKMNIQAVIDKFYPEENELKHIFMVHSRNVADKALALAHKHPELKLDLDFVEEAAMLHDIGIFLTDAPIFTAMVRIPTSATVIWEPT